MKYLLILLFLLSGCASLPQPRPWTTGEKALLVASCVAMVADGYTTIDGMHNGHSETNPIMGRHPSDAKVISVMAITQAVTVMIAHYWGPWRSMILGVKTGVNGAFAWHNSRTK